uniref:RRM domain-containing protein n=2 Tax=Kalanchoe fedtschenkoi TaxID=63787 RepID=A0A7N0U516_KALFE
MSRHQRVNHDSNSSRDIGEGSSARTRPYSFDEIMFNRKNKKSSQYQYHVTEAPGGIQIDKYDKRDKFCSHGARNKNSEISMSCTSRKEAVSSSVKVESIIVERVSSSLVEPNVKSEVVDDTRNKAVRYKNNAQNHEKTMEDEWPYETRSIEDTLGHSYSSLRRRNRVNTDEKSGREGQRKERNSSDHNNHDDYLRGEYKKKFKYSEGKERHKSRDLEKQGRENITFYRHALNRKNNDKDIVSRHDVLERDSELLGRRDRRGTPQPLHEQPSKRRRSSVSRECRRDRDQKLSPPGVQKHGSYHHQNHNISSSHVNKDRSERNVSKLHRNSKFGSGSPGRYKGQSGSSDKLGGYSPRKRRTEDAIRISSPGKGDPGKKRAGWDLPITESDIIMSSALLPSASTLSKPSTIQESASVFAVSSTQLESSPGSLCAQSTMSNVSVDSVQLTQSTRPMRRIYVENLPTSASEKTVMDFLNKLLLPTGANYIQGAQSCISCVVQKDKRQALVEFLTPEDASAALSFSGCSLLGSELRIRRPKDFVAVETAVPDKSITAVDAVGDVVEDSPLKIFIGGISRALSPTMLKEIACAFGPLKAFKYLLRSDFDEPRAFLQYIDNTITAKACAGLNGMKLGGQTLTVVQATTSKPSSDINGSLLYEVPEPAKALLAAPTEVLVIKNVFDPECFSSLPQLEIEETLEDVRMECSSFGSVKSINVVTYNPSTATSEIIEGDAAELVPTEVIRQNYDSEGLNTKLGGQNRISKSDVEENVEKPPNNKVARCNGVDDEEKLAACYCTLSSDIYSVRTEFTEKPSNLVDARGDTSKSGADLGGHPGTKGKTGEGELNSGRKKQSLNSSAELGCSTGVFIELVEKSSGAKQLEGLNCVLMPGSICVEYRRSEDTCIAAHCLNGRAFDNRTVSVEYMSLDLYRKKFSE